MNLWRSFFSILFVVVSLLLGAFAAVSMFDIVWADLNLPENVLRLASTLAGATLWVLALLVFFTSLTRKKTSNYLTFNNEDGTVNINTDAIADYVVRLSSEFPSVVHMKPVVKPARRHMDIVISLKVKAGAQVNDICELLQKRVRETIASGLGIDEV